MYAPTDNPYVFRYLVTGIKGEGIKQVYLPEVPKDKSKILDYGGYFKKQPLPAEWKEWMDWEDKANTDPKGKPIPFDDKTYVMHPKRADYAEQELDRRESGVWVWLQSPEGRKPFYITGLHYFIMQHWNLGFDFLYLDPHRELFYWIQFLEEDPKCLGGIFGTRRQVGKSVILGAWGVERTMRTREAHLGMQGENDTKMKTFYSQKILKGFDKLLDFFVPRYDKSGFQTEGIKFVAQKKRNARLSLEEIESALNSIIDRGPSGVNYYNSATLTGYIGEEPGKVEEVSVYERHNAVAPALGRKKGKALYGSTADALSDKTMYVFKQLVLESDYSIKKANGKTLSGLYFCFVPSHHMGDENLDDPMGGFDEYGFPTSEKNKEAIMADRAFYKDNPKKLTTLTRQFPMSIAEYFYASADKCEFDVLILQENLNRVDMEPHLSSRYEMKREGGNPDGKVYFDPAPNIGRSHVCWLPRNPALENRVIDHGPKAGKYRFEPMNDHVFCMGTDTIGYGQTSGGRQSKAYMYVKRKYDALLEGELTPELMVQRKREKYRYQTGIPVFEWSGRPTDPQQYYEQVVMACHFYGCKVLIERQAGMELVRYMENRGYASFIMYRPAFTRTSKRYDQVTQGAAASRGLTQQGTGILSRDIDYFGHCYFSRDLTEDLLNFDPLDTLEHDPSMAWMYTLMAEQAGEPEKVSTVLDLGRISRFGPTT